VEDNEQGIPRFAAFQNSNDSFCIFRKFGDVATRILETKQIKLCALIRQLQDLDKKDAEDESMRYRLSSIEHRGNWNTTQKDLLETIENKLKDYCEINCRRARMNRGSRS